MLSTQLRPYEGVFAENARMHKTPIRQVLAANFRRLLDEKGIKRQRIHDDIGMSTDTLHGIFHGTIAPSIDTLEQIAEVLKVQVWELLVDGEQMRRRVIESYLAPKSMNDEVTYLPQKAAEPTRKGVAHKRIKKQGGKGENHA